MKKYVLKFMAAVMTLVLCFGCIPAVSAASTKKTQLNQKNVTLIVGQTTSLRVLYNNTGKEPKFKSGNKKTATVDKGGLITAKKKGTVTITVSVGKKSYKCRVKVIKKYSPKTVNKKVKISKKVENHIMEITIKNSLAVALDIHLAGYTIDASGKTTPNRFYEITVPANTTVRRYYNLQNDVNYKIEKKKYQYLGCSDYKNVEAYSNSAFISSSNSYNVIAFKDKEALTVHSIEEKEDFFGTSLVVSYTEDYSRIVYDSAPSYSEYPYTIVFYKNGKMVHFKNISPAITTTDGKNTSEVDAADLGMTFTKADYDNYKVVVNPLVYLSTDANNRAEYTK